MRHTYDHDVVRFAGAATVIATPDTVSRPRILAIGVGAGTQDIILNEPDREPGDCP